MPEAAFPGTPFAAPAPTAPPSSELAVRSLGLDPKVAEIAARITLADPTSIVTFGSDVQKEATSKANELLARTRAGEAGEAGETLGNMLLTLKGFSPADAKEGNFISRMFTSAKTQVAKTLSQFDTVKGQVEQIAASMEEKKAVLLEDIKTADGIYQSTLTWFHALGDHIHAAEVALELGKGEVEALRQQAAQPNAHPLLPQQVADRQNALDELDRRLHDLRLTRQVVMQNLPALRMIQDNDRALVGKIQSVLTNTVPLWIQQMAQAILVQRMASTGKNLQAAADLTNQLLTQNAEALRQGNANVRTQVERGVFDVQAVIQANNSLIGALEDSLRIASEAKKARVEARASLDKAEADMKRALQGMARKTA